MKNTWGLGDCLQGQVNPVCHLYRWSNHRQYNAEIETPCPNVVRKKGEFILKAL